MVMCQFCMGETEDGIGCTNAPMLFSGRVFEPVRWGAERWDGCPPAISECVGCHTPPGGFHHHGCDREECPVCRRLFIMCSCDESEEWVHRVSRPRGQPRSRKRCCVGSTRSLAWPRAASRPTPKRRE